MEIKIHTFLLFILLIAGCTSEVIVEEDKVIEVQEEYDLIIVAFGDSLTEGLYVERENAYPAQLERELKQKGYSIKVFNSGLSGETSSGALARVDWVLKLNPDIVILGIGANDAIRGVDLDLTDSNIREIVSRLKAENITVILSGQVIFENLGPTYVNQFESMYPQIAGDLNSTLIPVFLQGVASNSSLNNPDEIHPNALGYEIVVKENILPVLIPLIDEKLR
jgi:acyl-CoA thioesterase-1